MANVPGWVSEAVDGAGSASIATPIEATDPAEGSAISVHVYWQPEDGNEPSVTDTEGNTYVLKASVNGANRRGRCFVATDIVSGPDFQVLVTWATAQFALGVAALEVVGADPTDAAGVAGGQYQGPGVTTADGTTTGTLGTPAEDGHLVHASSSSNSWPDSYEEESARTELGRIAAPGYLLHGYRVQGTAAAVSASFTQDSTASTLTLATSIKPAGEEEGLSATVAGAAESHADAAAAVRLSGTTAGAAEAAAAATAALRLVGTVTAAAESGAAVSATERLTAVVATAAEATSAITATERLVAAATAAAESAVAAAATARLTATVAGAAESFADAAGEAADLTATVAAAGESTVAATAAVRLVGTVSATAESASAVAATLRITATAAAASELAAALSATLRATAVVDARSEAGASIAATARVTATIAAAAEAAIAASTADTGTPGTHPLSVTAVALVKSAQHVARTKTATLEH